MATFWLEAGDDGTDRLDLADEVNYMVLANGFDVQDDAESENYQIVSLPLTIFGATKNAMFNARRAVLTKLHQANQGAQPVGSQPFVTLAVKFGDADTLVRWVVTEGTLSQGGLGSVFGNHLGTNDAPSILTLRVLKGALGEAIEYGPFAITGSAATLHIDGIPGDLPALAEIRAVDQSTNGAVVNRLRWACRSLPVMNAGDFAPVLPLTASGSGASGEDPNTFAGTFARLNATPTWATIGHVTGDAGQYTSGLYDVWGRVRDASTPLDSPQINTATVTAGPTLLQTKSISGSGSGASRELDFDLPTQPGSHLFLKIFTNTGATITLADADWALAVTSGSSPKTSLYYIENATSKVGSGVIQFSTNPAFAISIEEWAGPAASGSLDKTASNTEVASSSHSTGITATTTQAYELWVANFAKDFDGGWLGSPSGWTRVLMTPNSYYHSYYRIVTSVGAAESIYASTEPIDTSNLIATFKLAAATPPALPADSYTYWVTAYDSSSGVESAASSPFAVTLAVTSGVLLSWTAPANGSYTSFRIYWKKGAADIQYIDTGSTQTTYLHDSETATGTSDPPTTPLTIGQFRLAIGPESGATVDMYTPPVDSVLAFDQWEASYFGRCYLPSAAAPLSMAAPGFRIALQGKQTAQSVELDGDSLLLLPADEHQGEARYTTDSLATLREWVIGTTPDMRAYGFLRSTVDASEQGRVKTLGYVLLGPGDTTLVPLPTVAGGVWNVADISLSVTVVVRPRYAWLAGGI